LAQTARQSPDGLELATSALSGDRRAMARLLTLVENGHPEGRVALAKLFPRSGAAHIIGFTGSTGAGKSTLVGQVAREFRAHGLRLAVVAVDPSSHLTGGALLGDRLRMRDLFEDPGVFIRSMASRGHPGGIAHATRDVVTVLDALSMPVILLETVGAGQAQIDVARVAQTVVLVEAPGMGDDVQALKAGLMEIADIIVVNKADRPEARQTLHMLRRAQLEGTYGDGVKGGHSPQDGTDAGGGWRVPILEVSALEARGIEGLVDAINAHRDYLESSGMWRSLRAQHVRAEVEAWLQRYLMELADRRLGTAGFDAAVAAVLSGERDPATAARSLLRDLAGELTADVQLVPKCKEEPCRT
jgi:LAO/AO transport system kinase